MAWPDERGKGDEAVCGGKTIRLEVEVTLELYKALEGIAKDNLVEVGDIAKMALSTYAKPAGPKHSWFSEFSDMLGSVIKGLVLTSQEEAKGNDSSK